MTVGTLSDDPRPGEPAGHRSLRSNVLWASAGNLVLAGSQWGLTILLARFQSPVAVGRFTLALAVTAPVILFANLKLGSVQATDATRKYTFHDYLGLRLITTALALLFITALAFLVGKQRETTLVILCMGLARALDALCEVVYGLFQQRERLDFLGRSKILRGLTLVLLFAVAISSTGNLPVAVLMLAASWAVVLLFHDLRFGAALLSPSASARVRPAPLRFALGQVWPLNTSATTLARLAGLTYVLGFTVALDSLFVNIPRFFVGFLLGEEELGYFAILATLTFVGATMVGALGQSVAPRLAQLYAARDLRAFQALLLKLIGLCILIGIAGQVVALTFGNPLLGLVYGEPYIRQDRLLFWYMGVTSIQYCYLGLGTALSAMWRFRVQWPIELTSCLMLAALAALLIPGNGLQGVIWAILCANSFTAIAYVVTLLYIRRRAWPGPSREGPVECDEAPRAT